MIFELWPSVGGLPVNLAARHGPAKTGAATREPRPAFLQGFRHKEAQNSQDIFPDFEFGSAEVDQKTMPHP